MVKLKKITTFLLSTLFCFSLFGCSNKSSKTQEDTVKAEFEKAIDTYRSMTFENYVQKLEVSDPSIFSASVKDDYGENIKSIQYEGSSVYENRKDNSNKVTDYKILKDIYTKTSTYTDGNIKIKKAYVPGDGFKYVEKDGEKKKSEYKSAFTSVAYDTLNLDYIENITLTTEGSQKIFKFNYKPNMIFAWYFAAGDYLRVDSDIELTEFNGTLTIDEKNNIVKETFTADYRDKVTGATAKYTSTGEYSNNNQELVFPEDLSSYE